MIRRRPRFLRPLGSPTLTVPTRRRGSPRIALPLIAALTLGAWPAAGQTDEERAGARSLAEQGFNAFKAENWQEALDRFERAETLMHAPPHLLYAARASAKLGGFVKARELYNKILREELPASAPAAFKDAKRDAAAELPEVDKKIAYLTITVSGAPAGSAEVKLDGVLVPSALVGVERPVDPGTRQITVSAAGFEPQAQEITLEEAGRESLEITLTPTSDQAPPPASDEPSGGLSASTDDLATSSMSPLRLGAFISLGVGVVGLGLGTVFLIQAGGTQSDSDALFNDQANGCGLRTPLNPSACNKSDRLNDDAAGQRTLGAVGFIAGGAALATGVVLFILSGKEKQAEASGAQITPWVGMNSVGLSGTF